MEANKQMIGNWVKIKGNYGKPLKITTIDDTYNSINYFDGDAEGELTLQLNEIEPTPITPEILEKNGIKWFCTEPSGRKTYCCNEPVVQCTYIPNSGWLINVGACGSIKVRFVEISKIQYVHELQHAFRLCGIEKEIIL